MSDDVLKLIPEDKDYVPQREAAEAARALLEEFFPDGEQAEVDLSDTLKFRDGGGYFEQLECPCCEQVTQIDPFTKSDLGTECWRSLDEILSTEPDLEMLSVPMPCCGQATSIQSIDFHRAAGLSKFELSIWNPYGTLSDMQRVQLEDLLGCQLTQIQARY